MTVFSTHFFKKGKIEINKQMNCCKYDIMLQKQIQNVIIIKIQIWCCYERQINVGIDLIEYLKASKICHSEYIFFIFYEAQSD